MNTAIDTNRLPYKSGLCTVTLTGVGANTDLDRVHAISKVFPLVEWGILLGSKQTPRYPMIKEIWNMLDNSKNIRYALHLCGDYAKKWLNGDSDLEFLSYSASRIQINIREKGVDFGNFVETVDKFGWGQDIRIITQYNDNTLNLTEALKGIYTSNHNLLFDASGGNGITRGEWPTSFDHVMCGYAGGLGPDNLVALLPKIYEAANGNPFWIDMESSVRTNDELDLNKCIDVLEICTKFKANELRI